MTNKLIQISLPSKLQSDRQDIREWLCENAGKPNVDWWMITGPPENPDRDAYGFKTKPEQCDIHVSFPRPDRAMLFKLTWGGQ